MKTLEQTIQNLTEQFGITPQSVVAHREGGFSLTLITKKSADKLNDVFSKEYKTVLEKHPKRDTWYLTVNPV